MASSIRKAQKSLPYLSTVNIFYEFPVLNLMQVGTMSSGDGTFCRWFNINQTVWLCISLCSRLKVFLTTNDNRTTQIVELVINQIKIKRQSCDVTQLVAEYFREWQICLPEQTTCLFFLYCPKGCDLTKLQPKSSIVCTRKMRKRQIFCLC